MIQKFGAAILLTVLASLSLAVSADDIFDIDDKLIANTLVVKVRKGEKNECLRMQNYDTCQLLEINGKPIISDYYVSIEAAFPNKFNPNVIFVTGSTGGNACCSKHYLIDVTTTQTLILEIVSLPKPYLEKPVISLFDSGFTYENFGDEKGEYGEDIWKTYQYKYGSGKIQILKSFPKHYSTSMDKKKYPYEILDDPINRASLIKVMGKSYFLDMRERLVVQGEIKKYPNSIYVGEGCMPHSCGSEEAMVVLDAIKKQAWAIYMYDEKGLTKVRLFGQLPDEVGGVRDIFIKWMANKKLSWSQVQKMSYSKESSRDEDASISGGLPPIKLKK